MALAEIFYTDRTIISGLANAASPASLLADLHTLIMSQGDWVATVFSNGHEYTIHSPQASFAGPTFGAKVRIWNPADPSFPDCIGIQFLSLDSSAIGLIHHLQTNRVSGDFGVPPLPNYLVWINQCSIFVAPPGLSRYVNFGQVGKVSFSGGVPRIYTISAVKGNGQIVYVTDAWWSGSDECNNIGLGVSKAFRNSFYCGYFSTYYATLDLDPGNPSPVYQGLRLNNTPISFTPGSGTVTPLLTALQLGSVKTGPLGDFSYRLSTFPDGILWWGPAADGSQPHAFWYEPSLLWADTDTTIATLVGQIYDAALASAPLPLEAEFETTVGLTKRTWRNYLLNRNDSAFLWDDARVLALMLMLTKTVIPTQGGESAGGFTPQVTKPPWSG